MAVCKMDMMAVRQAVIHENLEGVNLRGFVVNMRLPCTKPQRVTVVGNVQRRLPSVSVRVSSQPSAKLPGRCNASPEGDSDGKPSKNYDVNEVVEEVVKEEGDELPESEKEAPEPLPEGEPSPFSPAIDLDTDDTLHAVQGERVSKDSLIEPPRAATQESAASSSLGEGLGVSEQSTLSTDPVGGSAKSGGRDWRVYSLKRNVNREAGETGACSASRVSATLEKASGAAEMQQQQVLFGFSESSCDEGSSFLAEAGILQEDGGKSVDDYKLRAHIFEKSAEFFTALNDRRTHSVV